ncbi:hypothetical Protein YC6258_04221 [Gynuella sunshinyii YC6258]|uniref:Uncharacterized protein n=1 Tax=Gynuella sunshinyii YC6258 TaxID=1445510 RepID=A0A0C5VAC2_9GAMM|nr:hypothetical Protein YC6258_04221 [Gynuella sunshinyii YC6258]
MIYAARVMIQKLPKYPESVYSRRKKWSFQWSSKSLEFHFLADHEKSHPSNWLFK